MNKRLVFHTTGYILMIEAILFFLPVIVALIYHDSSLKALLISIVITGIAGILLYEIKPRSMTVYAREGFAIVALSWILLSAFGALPFVISGKIPHYIDAFFEIVSGFTTTGSTILTQVETLGKALLFWRSFSHWVGGMGVLVFAMLILPLGGSHSIHLMRAEVPGPTMDKLVPKMRTTAIILYQMYFVLTLIEVALLCFGHMPLYDSLVHAFGTAGTGGFSCKTLSIAAYHSSYLEIVIGIFMLLFGVNFNLYYLVLIHHGKEAFKNEELRAYLGVIAFATITIAINIIHQCKGFGQALRYAFFQVSSIITTTGYSSTNFDKWPQYSRMMLVLLMFIGACASSTGGGIKISRILLLLRHAKGSIQHMIHPHAVCTVQMDKKAVDDSVLHDANTYLICYAAIAAISTMLVSLDNFSFETTFTAMATCLNNVGPGLAQIGPLGSFHDFSPFSKLILSFDMLVGRLEIFPMLILFSPGLWHKKDHLIIASPNKRFH